ncbi:uncharacterized protein MYCFIDRAFT_211405 [Pseudocercospora fijiensis CIRAD86]|uniref:Uncharacterized protein n=1 Tax=Pseudocercospora fijiensis (strain CIRAD86) TaxID=383855 RepID=M3AWS4_PSEFD|nr:uncharacterized protein MYCFIDRAFT_211405 [Pseudocercospora fijiensis CIRAD86]EME81568.1 hypothetical protein MYCFIDRAFT_211405 [Pseudocercospora fijiensis CIRAD86]
MEPSFFSHLPPEIRNAIYEYVLYEPHGAEIWDEPGLLQSSSMIRAEAELMYYAINSFRTTIHEDHMNHHLCQWLKRKAGQRIHLIRGLDIYVEMPSLQEVEDCDDNSTFFLLTHIVEELQATSFKNRSTECVVRWSLNGASDSESFENINEMSAIDQDRFRGAKFLLLFMVNGAEKTLDALHAEDSEAVLEGFDAVVRRNRGRGFVG